MKNTNTQNKTSETKELVEGTGCTGNACYLVVTVRANGSWKHIEKFDTKAEAINWLKWA